MPQNLLKNIFWKINLIKMMKIFICEKTYYPTFLDDCPHFPHIKIFIILIKLIFQNNFLNKFCGIFPIFFGGVATFAVEIWSWKLFQI